MDELIVILRAWDRTVSRRLRHYVLARDQWRCYLCAAELVPGRECQTTGDYRRMETLDHVIPFSEGGETSADNLRACCQQCNQARSRKQRTVNRTAKRRDRRKRNRTPQPPPVRRVYPLTNPDRLSEKRANVLRATLETHARIVAWK